MVAGVEYAVDDLGCVPVEYVVSAEWCAFVTVWCVGEVIVCEGCTVVD